MRRGIPIVSLVLVAALSATALMPADAAHRSARRTDCGKIRSTSVWTKAKVVVLRRVRCRAARRVARHFDHTGDLAFGHWRCGLAHGGGRRLFSCGWPRQAGDIRDWRHALVAFGAGHRR